MPAKLSEEIIHRVQSQAIDAFNALECQGLARVDFFLTDQGGLYINEVNTIPGFTPISLYPQLFEVSGIPFSKLIETLIELAMEKKLI